MQPSPNSTIARWPHMAAFISGVAASDDSAPSASAVPSGLGGCTGMLEREGC
jgi:hypothetical protein